MPIKISKMIVHKLNVNNALPILNNKCVDLTNKKLEAALPFFKKHITNSRKQGSMKSCQFNDLDDNSVRKSMTKIIESLGNNSFEEIFIEESRHQTLRLAERIRKSTSRSDGSLFVILYESNDRQYIGYLKMDPNDGVQILEDLTIEVREDMLPSINEKLHKSALIELKEYRENEFHLRILDKQQGDKEPAQFFIEKFLNAIELSSNKNMTRYIQSQLSYSFDQLIGEENVPVLDNILRVNFMQKEEFNIDIDLEPIIRPLLKETFKTLDLKDSISDFKDQILKVYPDADFTFKPDVESIKEMIFRTPDKNVEVKFSPELVMNEDYFIKHKDNGDVIISLKNGIGAELTEVPTRRR